MHGKLHSLGDPAASGRNSQGGNLKTSALSKFGTHNTSPFALGMRRRGKNPRLVAAGRSLVQSRRKNILNAACGR